MWLTLVPDGAYWLNAAARDAIPIRGFHLTSGSVAYLLASPTAVVPIPPTLVLVVGGIVALGVLRRRRA